MAQAHTLRKHDLIDNEGQVLRLTGDARETPDCPDGTVKVRAVNGRDPVKDYVDRDAYGAFMPRDADVKVIRRSRR